jgi:glycosyltransferase involved in cell wall biosynthesis
MVKKKVLLISPGLPYPPTDGHKLKLYNLCLQLSKNVDLNIIIISNEVLTLDCELFLKQNFQSYKIFRFHKIQYFCNLVKTIFRREIPLQVGFYTFSKVVNFIRTFDVDFVIFNLVRTTGYLNYFPKHKIILDLVDSIGLNYLKSKSNTSSLYYKMIYYLETNRLLNYEKKVISKAKATLFVNQIETDYFDYLGNVFCLPNGVNKYLFDVDDVPIEPIVCFFGAMFYQPNVDAVLWFNNYVFPLLDDKIKFYIIGGKPTKDILKLRTDRIVVTDYMENPYFLIKSALCTVAPMQTGGGIQNKILESMALGQITLTNNMGANPIVGHKNLENILIANTPQEFAYYINEIFKDPLKFNNIKLNSQIFIKNNFSWDNYGLEFLKFLK